MSAGVPTGWLIPSGALAVVRVAEGSEVRRVVPSWSLGTESIDVVDVRGWFDTAFWVFADSVGLEKSSASTSPLSVIATGRCRRTMGFALSPGILIVFLAPLACS